MSASNESPTPIVPPRPKADAKKATNMVMEARTIVDIVKEYQKKLALNLGEEKYRGFKENLDKFAAIKFGNVVTASEAQTYASLAKDVIDGFKTHKQDIDKSNALVAKIPYFIRSMEEAKDILGKFRLYESQDGFNPTQEEYGDKYEQLSKALKNFINIEKMKKRNLNENAYNFNDNLAAAEELKTQFTEHKNKVDADVETIKQEASMEKSTKELPATTTPKKSALKQQDSGPRRDRPPGITFASNVNIKRIERRKKVVLDLNPKQPHAEDEYARDRRDASLPRSEEEYELQKHRRNTIKLANNPPSEEFFASQLEKDPSDKYTREAHEHGTRVAALEEIENLKAAAGPIGSSTQKPTKKSWVSRIMNSRIINKLRSKPQDKIL